jgi:serine/threonine protein kinase
METAASDQPRQDGPPAGLPDDPLTSYNPERSRADGSDWLSGMIEETVGGGVPTPEGGRPKKGANGSEPELSLWSMRGSGSLEREGAAIAAGEAHTPAPAFELKEMVAKGGFGEVWSATQISLKRVVAVKMPRQDMRGMVEGDEFKKRLLEAAFRQEAITAANLQHPNIVPIHDLGKDEEGRPLLAMKLAKGKAWHDVVSDDWADTPVLDFLGKHLPILVDVSMAVAFAHARGIAHRDIKPSQVIVGEFGEVFLMDWGLAVVFDREKLAAEVPEAARHLAPDLKSAASPAGTTAYMAPEQTFGTAVGVGPWTDVYLLGGTLYYLLTGTHPHQGETSRAIFWKAREGVVPPPEERAADRHIPKALSDLCARAMAPDAKQRLGSALEFADRLRDYLTGATKRRESEGLCDDAAASLASAEANYRDFAACNALLDNARALWPGNPRLPELRAAAVGRYASAALKKRDLGLARAQAERLDEGEGQEKLLREIRREEARLAARERQRLLALAACGLFLLILLGLSAKHSSDLAAESQRANASSLEAQAARAKSEERRADVENLLNFMLVDLRRDLAPIGRLEPLEEVARKTIEYLDKIPADEESRQGKRQRGIAYESIGDVFKDQGNLEEAMKAFQTSLQIRRSLAAENPDDLQLRRELASTLENIAGVHSDRAEHAKSLELRREALEIARALERTRPQEAALQRDIAVALHGIGMTLGSMGQPAESLEAYQESLATWEALERKTPGDNAVESGLAAIHNNLGVFYMNAGMLQDARKHFYASHEIRDRRGLEDPENAIKVHQRAWSYCNVGWVFRAEKKYEESLAAYQTALDIRKSLLLLDPINAEWQRDVAVSLELLAQVGEEAGQVAEPAERLREATFVWKRLAENNPTNPRWRTHYTASIGRLLNFLVDQENTAEALRVAEKFIGDIEPLADASTVPEWREARLGALGTLARLRVLHGDAVGALQTRDQLVAARELAMEEAPDGGGELPARRYVVALLDRADALAANERFAEADQQRLDALAFAAARLPEAPPRLPWLRIVAQTHASIARAHAAEKRPKEAYDAWRVAVATLEEGLEESPRDASASQSVLVAHGALLELAREIDGPLGEAREKERQLVQVRRFGELADWPAQTINYEAWGYVELGRLWRDQGEEERAESAFRRSIELFQPLLERVENNWDRISLGMLDTWAVAQLELKEAENARALVDFLLAKGWDDPGFLALCAANGIPVPEAAPQPAAPPPAGRVEAPPRSE